MSYDQEALVFFFLAVPDARQDLKLKPKIVQIYPVGEGTLQIIFIQIMFTSRLIRQ